MKFIIPLFSVLLFAACGFQPVYGVNKYEKTGVEAHLAQIEIGNIRDREGQFLRNALIDRFYPAKRPAQPVYMLEISEIIESLIDLDVTKSADATRGQLKLSTTIQLTNKRSGEVLLRHPIHSIASFNILSSEFSTRVSEESTRQNVLNDLARQIELRLNLYFKQAQG